MSSAFARGACPGLSSPMQTGDGLLARFLPAAPIALDDFIGVCAAARRRGNGIIEVSARGSLQIRGLTEASAPRFAKDIARLGLDICEGVPVIGDPLPGDPAALIDTSAIPAALRRTIAESALRLAPKVSVLVDGGGCINLDQLFADIRLRAVARIDGAALQLAIAGNAHSATPLDVVAPENAATAVVDLLARIAALGPMARAADLLPCPPLAEHDTMAPRTKRVDAVGHHLLRDGAAVGVGLGFGHADAGALTELARAAKTRGATWARSAPGRTLLLGPLSEVGAATTRHAAASLGFVTDASDPRRRIAACPGAPLCMHGLIAARALAAETAREMPLPSGDDTVMHVSGCAKGCAHPGLAPLTVVGTERGCGIVHNGTARAAPSEYVAAGELVSALTRRREAVHA